MYPLARIIFPRSQKVRLTSIMSRASTSSLPAASVGRGIWLGVFLVFGVLVTVGVAALLNRYENKGIWLLGGALVLGPIGIYMVAAAVPEGVVAWRHLRSELRWFHWLLLTIFFGASVWRIREVADATNNPLDSAALLRVIPQFFVGCFLFLRLVRKKTPWVKYLFTGVPLWMGLYCLACLVSTLWSINAPWTAYKSVELTLDFGIMAAILATIREPEEFSSVWNWVWVIYGLELVWTWVSIPLWPEEALGDGLRLAGVIPNVSSNGIGATGAIVAVIALCRLLPLSGKAHDRSLYWFLFLFGITSMGFAQTRNAIAGFAAAALLIFFFTKRIKWVVFTSVPTALIFIAVGGPALLMTYLLRGQSDAELVSASSRTMWWGFGWQEFLLRPWTGWGAFVGGKFVVLSKLGLNIPTLHSDYVETLVDIGFWGVIPLVISVLVVWWYLVRGVYSPLLHPDERQLAMEGACIMAIATFRSIFDIELAWHAPLMFMLLVGYAEMIRRTILRRRQEAEADRITARVLSQW